VAFQRGVLAELMGQHEKALEQYQAAADSSPPSPTALCNLASLHLTAGRTELALTAARRAVELLPSDPLAIANLVVCYRRAGEAAGAQAVLSAHREHLPSELRDRLSEMMESAPGPTVFWNLVEATLTLANRAERGGDLARAERLLRRARALDPGSIEAVLELGALLGGQKREAEALAVYDEFLAVAPRCAFVRFGRGNVLLRQDRLPEAVGEYRRCLSDLPQWSDPRINLIAALVKSGKKKEARAEVEALESAGLPPEMMAALRQSVQ
jgi:tetratricopeptide (TPR) repeat protein